MPLVVKRPSVARRSSATPLPEMILPMLATGGVLPADESGWSFEFKWDGMRAITRWDGKRLNILSRNSNDITHQYPELHDLGEALGKHRVILDGEIVALDDVDRPSFARLQRRMHSSNLPAIARLSRDVPIVYILFDILHLDRRSTISLPLTERQALLETLTLAGPSWRVSPARVGDGKSMLAVARKHLLEGIVAKRLDSVYLPGQRSSEWRKIKLVQRQEFVVGGWSTQVGTADQLGALHVGYYDCPPSVENGCAGTLHYAGAVGTGFDASTRAMLLMHLRRYATDKSRFNARLPRKDVRFVEPKLVVEIAYRRWPNEGLLQHASYAGLRTDKEPDEVVCESRIGTISPGS